MVFSGVLSSKTSWNCDRLHISNAIEGTALLLLEKNNSVQAKLCLNLWI